MIPKRVFISGPNDDQLNAMFMGRSEYRVVQDAKSADLYCFQGGADVHPSLYSEEVLQGTYVNKDRDRQDIDTFEIAKNKPKVGICRGGQFLNVMSDGEMWQHVDNHMQPHTMINLLPMPGIFTAGFEVDVTSDHHQMMVPNLEYAEIIGISHKATVFRAPPKSERTIPEYDTEVVFYNHTNSLCFQPHPEYNYKVYCRTYFFKLMEFFYG